MDGATALGTVALDASGRAELSVASLGPGGHAITALYNGSGGFQQGHSGAVAQSVAEAGTQVILVPRPTLRKKKVITLGLSAEVQPLPPGDGTPSGTVTFLYKKKTLGMAVLADGQATLSVKPKSVLNKAITVVYSGDGDFQAATIASARLTSQSLVSPARTVYSAIRRSPARFSRLDWTGHIRRS